MRRVDWINKLIKETIKVDILKINEIHKKVCKKEICSVTLNGEQIETGIFISRDPINVSTECGRRWVIDRITE